MAYQESKAYDILKFNEQIVKPCDKSHTFTGDSQEIVVHRKILKPLQFIL